MNYKLFSALSFVAGAAVGSVVTWKLLKSKYEQIAQEEIESVKEVYSKKNTPPSIDECVDEIIRQSDAKPSVLEYAAKIEELKYGGEVARGEKKTEENEGKEDDSMKEEPYVISFEDFEDGDYEKETLTYFADGVLTDWYKEIIDNIEEVVGLDALTNFDEYADGDTVYVRNDYQYTDYEIQRDYRNYSEVFVESTEG